MSEITQKEISSIIKTMDEISKNAHKIEYFGNKVLPVDDVDKALELIRQITTGKYEQVVHCKDCKFLGIKDFVTGYCKKDMCGIINPNDFCSHGKKKESAN